MTPIPPEIDRILWATAESRDPRAYEEFAERYPTYRNELVERVALIRGLRAARPAREAPPLRLTPAPRPSPRHRTLSFALAGVFVASLAFATVTTVQNWSSPPTKDPPPAIITGSGFKPDPDASHSAPKPNGLNAMPKNLRTDEPSLQPPASNDPFERLVTIDSEKVRLSVLIKTIAAQARLRLTVAPGFEDQDVDARYLETSARLALEDLGQNFGFSLVVQQDNEALIIPTTDISKPPITVPDGNYSEPSEGHTGVKDPASLPNHRGN